MAYNAIERLAIYVALARVGLVAVPINFRLAGPEIADIVQHTEARAVIVIGEREMPRTASGKIQHRVPRERIVVTRT